ncbi:mandelate racemase/muconate lactonizing enzyme family protein [Numidum massiliense]|uniref:mandelate racemase/muconate lactonizing enzyme family protein n=1 Tax=Numidum massiliense TaxID=1522315 RepID=UPI000AF3AA27|nr:enolase C-terminal domain-like protein [Numidum massiliense]
MKIQHVEAFPVLLPMKRNFSTSRGSVGSKQTGASHVYVKITSDDGTVGWGEARPSHRWSYETLESVTSTIRHYLGPALIGENPLHIRQLHHIMNREIAAGISIGQPIAKSGIDLALHDLIAKRERKPLPHLWQTAATQPIKLSYLISTNDPQEAAKLATIAREEGYEGVDVKIGLTPARDYDVLQAVKEAAPNLFFRVDANQAYTLSQAIELIKKMGPLGVDVFEQPLPADDLLGHAKLRARSSIPIALDESVWSPRDVLRAIRLDAADTIVIKTSKMGGLYYSRLSGEIAREADLSLLGGGLTESTLGLTASAYLFSALQISTPVDLNGPFFLADDAIHAGATVRKGNVHFPVEAGIGCLIDEEKLATYAAPI